MAKMDKKRYHGKSEGRRGIVMADKSAISNLPQSVQYYETMEPRRYANDVAEMDGMDRTIYDQIGADGAGLAKNKSKWRF